MADRPAITPEPAPKRTDSPAVWPLVIASVPNLIAYAPKWLAGLLASDMEARNAAGVQKYGVPLQVENGRRADVDAYQEALDLCAYSRQQYESVRTEAWRRLFEESVRLAAGILYQMELDKSAKQEGA